MKVLSLLSICLFACSHGEWTTETEVLQDVRTSTESPDWVEISTQASLDRKDVTERWEESTVESSTTEQESTTLATTTRGDLEIEITTVDGGAATTEEHLVTQARSPVVVTTESPLIDEDDQDVTNAAIDQEISGAISRASLDPKIISDKVMSGSVGGFLPISFEAGLSDVKLFNLSSFSRRRPVKLRKTSLENNVELEIDLESDSLIITGSAALYFLGVGPRFDFEGTIDSVKLRVLLSYHQPKGSGSSGAVRVKQFDLLSDKITPSLKVTRPRSITKFVSNIFFGRIVPYLGQFLKPVIETTGREIVHELVSDHGFVHSIMKRYHESNYIIDRNEEFTFDEDPVN